MDGSSLFLLERVRHDLSIGHNPHPDRIGEATEPLPQGEW
jgi:hypothetical protein